MADDIKPDFPEVVAQEAKTVGDENLSPREVTVEVNKESVPAQVPGKADAPAETVKVHEVVVATDTVITDTSDPLAVQVPDAGRGSLDLPIHSLDAPTPEEQFAASAKPAKKAAAPASSDK